MINSENQAIISILDGHYSQIRDIETKHNIMGREGDYRPRIEYYHDAIRAFSSNDNNPYSKYDRLAPERVAHDVAILRQICEKPLVTDRGDHHLSPHADVAYKMSGKAGVRPDRTVRIELAQKYKDYTVLFVALLADKIEENTIIRVEEADMLSQECQQMQEVLAKLEKGEISTEEVLQIATTLENDDLHNLITTLLSNKKLKGYKIKALISKLKEMTDVIEKEKRDVEEAGHNFATSQLAVYETSIDAVKRLVANGLNIAGKFMQNATDRGQGQGQGQNR